MLCKVEAVERDAPEPVKGMDHPQPVRAAGRVIRNLTTLHTRKEVAKTRTYQVECVQRRVGWPYEAASAGARAMQWGTLVSGYSQP